MPPRDAHAAKSQESAVIAAARLVVATYPHLSNPNAGSDLDYYMAQLRDEIALLDMGAKP